MEGTDILPAHSHAVTRTVLHVPYQLNQQKQVAQLLRDVNIPDYVMQANDNDRNVNIQCSVGFYEAVAKPALASLTTDYHYQTHGVSVTCTVVRKMLDTHSSTSGLLLRFELSGPGVSPSHAPLSVHLHNTQRKVQVQGGGTMPDQSKAALWFATNILNDMFIDQAKAKDYQINEINNLITRAASSTLNQESRQSSVPLPATNCYHCRKKFSTTSKPTACNICNHVKHATKCAPCPRTLESVPPPALAPRIPTSTSSTMTAIEPETGISSSLPSVSSSQELIARVVSCEDSVVSITLPSTVGSASITTSSTMPLPSTHTVTTTITPILSTQTVLTVSATGTTDPPPPTTSLPAPSVSTQSVPRKPGKPKKQSILALSHEAAEIAFLKQELNYATTKITMLDAEISDLNKTIQIQDSRLKIFEEAKNKDCSDKFLSADHQNRIHTQPCPQTLHQSCFFYHPPPCHSGHVHHHEQTHRNELEKVLKAVEKLSEEVKIIKLIIRRPLDPDPPDRSSVQGLSHPVNESPDREPGELLCQPPPSPIHRLAENTTAAGGHNDIVQVDIHEIPNNVSMSSIEEFIPSPFPTRPPEDNLNLNLPTSQP